MSKDKKVHLVAWNNCGAIDWRCTLETMCEKDIPDPFQLAVWDNLPTGAKIDLTAVNAIDTCPKCFTRVLEINDRHTIYAIKSKASLREAIKEEL